MRDGLHWISRENSLVKLIELSSIKIEYCYYYLFSLSGLPCAEFNSNEQGVWTKYDRTNHWRKESGFFSFENYAWVIQFDVWTIFVSLKIDLTSLLKFAALIFQKLAYQLVACKRFSKFCLTSAYQDMLRDSETWCSYKLGTKILALFIFSVVYLCWHWHHKWLSSKPTGRCIFVNCLASWNLDGLQ